MKSLAKRQNLLWLLLIPLLWWGLRQAPWAEIWQTLASLSLVQGALLLAINAAIFALFSSRWWLITRAQGYRRSFISLTGYRLASFAISYFTPGTQFGGEPLQVHMLKSRHGLSSAAALASVSLDKLFELLANFTFLFAGLVFIFFQPSTGANLLLAPLVAVLLSLPLLYLLALWFGRAPLTGLLARLPEGLRRHNWLDKSGGLVGETEGHIASLMRRRPAAIWGAFALSGLIWLAMLGEYWLSLSFLGGKLNFSETIMALTAARLAFLTPLPGGLGALEAGQAAALTALGYGPALGLSISLLIRGRDILFGLAGLWWGAVLARRIPITGAAAPSDHAGTPGANPSTITLLGGKTHE